MSQFLHHLVARSLAHLPAIQPRRPSLFEGRSAARTAFTEERVENIAPARSEVVSPPTLPASPLQSLAPIAGANPGHIAGTSMVLREAPPISSVPVARAPNHTAQASAELPPRPIPSPTPAPRSTLAPRLIESVRAATVTPVPVAESLRQFNPSHPIREAPSPLLPAVSSLLVERVVEREQEMRRGTAARENLAPVAPPTPVALTAPVPPPARLARAASAPAEAGPFRDAVAPPPIVQVSIGRIDIRAVHPPAPAPTRSASLHRRPLVSLEDYLKQRAAS